MPNWCENILKVEGPAKEIARFKKAAKGRGPYSTRKDPVRVLSLHALVPQPTKFKKEGSDWYNWRLANWGTKWDVDSRYISEDKECLEYGFGSAWSPPVEWLAQVGPKFPKLSFRLWYAEGGCYFAGVCTVENDNVSNEEKDYVEAQIEERGSYDVDCSYCDGPMSIESKDAVRICDECIDHRCANCKNEDAVHIDGKCPFDASMFQHISAETSNEESLGQPPPLHGLSAGAHQE
jgi:hypothetical protein